MTKLSPVQLKRKVYNSARWRSLRLKIFERDDWRCIKCKAPGRLECDHIIPMHKGGAIWLQSNLRTLCRSCHIESHKSKKTRSDKLRNVFRRILDIAPI